MQLNFTTTVLVITVLLSIPGNALFSQEQATANSREFTLHYGAKILDIAPGSNFKIWFPIATTTSHQDITLRNVRVPGDLAINTEPNYGNKIGFSSGTAGDKEVGFSVDYLVKRKEAGMTQPRRLEISERNKFLAPNSMVPITGKPLNLLQGKNLSKQPMAIGQQIYEIVEQHMRYDKSKPGYGTGDAVWACDSRFGNCTDFHSLFISLARSRQIPAKFEIGFPIPNDKTSGEIGGYHCWAWFHARDNGWVPVDISEADKHPNLKKYYFGKLTADRVAFTTGRDIKLVPESLEKPLNYFVYPHVEVDGLVWPKDKIQLDFSFENHKKKDPA